MILSPILATLSPIPTALAIRQAIAGLVELFQALSGPSKKSIQGLWAELVVIRNAAEPSQLAAAWHREPHERFDFASGSQRIEVKSSGNRRRQHHFALAQLIPSQGSEIIIASLFAERSGGGVSVQEMFGQVRDSLDLIPSLQAQFDATFYASLGSDWAEMLDEAFDLELARDSLAFFPAESVPRLQGPFPPSISDIRFCSDLSAAIPEGAEELRSRGGLFAALVPSR